MTDFAARASTLRLAAVQARHRADSIAVRQVPGDPFGEEYASALRDHYETETELHERWAGVYEIADERAGRRAERLALVGGS